MADITLTDSSSLSANATVFDDSVLGKTLPSVMHFLRSDVIGSMGQTLDKVQINSLSIGFDYEPKFSLAGGTVTFTAGGGPTGEIDLYKPAGGGKPSSLFPIDQFGTDIEMRSNYYLALSFQLSLIEKMKATLGAFCLMPTVAATGSAKLYLPFAPDAQSSYPTLKSALETLCGTFVLPSSIDDITKLPVGSVFAYDSQGTVGFKGSFDVLAAVNPTATPGVSTSFGPITIDAGPSVTIGGGFSLTGEFQVRIWKKSANVFQIGYYKKQGASFTVSFDASVGVDVAVGSYDIVAKIYGLLGDSGKLDPNWLKANVPSSVADDVQAAYKAAVQTKLSIAIDEECDTSLTDQTAFSWNFDLMALDSTSQDAFASLIRGDLSPLMSGTPLPAGITKAGSVFDRMKETKHTFTFNFLGLFDHASVQDAVRKMGTKISEDGQLVITDTAHLTRLSATVTPFVKSDQLRKVFSEDCVATVGYAVSLGQLAPQLKVDYSYFDYESHAHISDLQLFVDTAGRLGESDAKADWANVIQAGISSQSASLFATLTYEAASGVKLFLDQDANPRSIPDFERVGRNALLVTPGLGLHPEFTTRLADDVQWQEISKAGTAQNFYGVIGVDQINPPQWATISFAWTVHILFWAPAMHSTGQALQAISQYLTQHPGIDPLNDRGFLARRQAFVSQLQNAIQKAPLFDDALGLMTMFLAAPPVNKNVVITYAGKKTAYT
ncbi:hypothetical protein [Alloacidobacterium sp.]|uniref:hypothetical protein n=1 Tax=Alloacidobacterium sp. TaxID=2951999 RepID=UPI002D2B925C|nr:hypothetical protein [Alloacidobacterium sp.]HYK37850.1 hypothetical protein [Alloacidobacterium sp.]